MVKEKFKDWEHLVFGIYPVNTVLRAVKDPDWQAVRLAMKGEPMWVKKMCLETWLTDATAEQLPQRCIQVTNYVNALKRGGLFTY